MATILAGVVVATTAAWLLFFRNRGSPTKPNIPYLDLEGEKTPMRYLTETGSLMAKGYNQFSKQGLPFSILNLSDPGSPLVILPLKYADEVAQAPQNKLSLREYFARFGLVKYSHGPPVTEDVQRVARTNLNRALNDMVTPLRLSCLDAFNKDMPKCPQWTSVKAHGVLMSIFVHMDSLMLVGPHLRDDWVALAFEYLPVFLKATANVRTGYLPFLRWTAAYVDPQVKSVIKIRRKIGNWLQPIHESRLAELDSGVEGKHSDALQWLIEDFRGRGKKPSPDELTQSLLLLTVSSIHQTTLAALWLLFDLIDHPEIITEIRDEISRVKAQHGEWTRRALDDLQIMDSFMTETVRVHSHTETTLNRMVVKPHTFKDGLSLPVGTQISFPTRQYSMDPDLHPNPKAFDSKRQLRKRERNDGVNYHFASTADTLGWGGGPHACPGRFLAQVVLKLIFVHILTHYDFKHPEGTTQANTDKQIGILSQPNVDAQILFKEIGT